MTTSIVDEIFEEQIRYEKKYGPKTTVLFQIGSFFECYGLDNEEEKIGNVAGIAELLNIVKTKKDKKNPENSRKNPDLCGFPCAALQRYMGVLVQAGWTCVIFEQVPTTAEERKQGAKGDFKRVRAQVVSPGTLIDESTQFESNHVMCFVVKKEKQVRGREILRLGSASYDLSTGQSTAYEAMDVQIDKSFAISEGVRMIKSFNPREIVLYGDLTNELQDALEVGDRVVHVRSTNPGEEKLSFMNQFLEDFYPNRGHLSPIEFVDLEHKQLAFTAYVILLRFVFDHNESALGDLQKPKVLNELECLCLENNAIQQLNVLPMGTVTTRATPSHVRSLMDVVGYCKTPMGHRRLRDRLCRPLMIASEIILRHDQVEGLLLHDLQEDLQKKLKGVGDIERITRKMCTAIEGKGIEPVDILKMWSGTEACVQCLSMLGGVGHRCNALDRLIGDNKSLSAELSEMHAYLGRVFDRQALESISNERSIFARGHNDEIDKLFATLHKDKEILERYRQVFNDVLPKPTKIPSGKASSAVGNKEVNYDNMIRLEYNDKDKDKDKDKDDGWAMVTTKKRVDDLKRYLPLVIQNEMRSSDSPDQYSTVTTEEHVNEKTLILDASISTVKIATPVFRQASYNYRECLKRIKSGCRGLFAEICDTICKQYGRILKEICEIIIQVDLCACAADTAIKRKHCRPKINSEKGPSFLQARGLRHAIIEALPTGTEYVPSNVSLGRNLSLQQNASDSQIAYEGMENMDGMLLYGCNSAGKSCMMKAIGLSIILAQAGFYVPSDTFLFRPFSNVMTRILSNDDIFKGQSSFGKEMMELSSILKRADDKCLVLGDEIANSTESTSGLAIVASAIERLANANTKFVFATHLHELAKLDFIKDLKNIRHFHLEVRYDGARDVLIYDRILREGSGTAVYGLEIARAMGMDDKFLETAHGIRRQLLQTDKAVISDRSSRYNANVFMRPCQICNEPGSDVHHIKEQATADRNGMVGNVHKNNLSNLVVLCESCHDKVHQTKTLEIRGYVQTSNGRKLDFAQSTPISTPNSRKEKSCLQQFKYTTNATKASPAKSRHKKAEDMIHVRNTIFCG